LRDRGPVRTIPLGGRDSKEILQLIDKLWSATSGDTNPIRIVVPSSDSLIRKRVLGEEEAPTRNRGFRNPEQNTNAPLSRPIQYQRGAAKSENDGLIFTSSEQKAEGQTKQEKKTPPENNSDQSVKEKSKAQNNLKQPTPQTVKSNPIAISANGDNLIISSTDLEALNRLEQMIEALTQAIPPKSQWTVFYLRSADATATAKMLESLFPTSSVSDMASGSGMFGGLSSIGGSLMDATGLTTLGMGPQTLRIIPESRSNALYVTGPADKVRSVEQMLKVLDASELPASLRDRSPGIIPVEFASVIDVEKIVKELYKDYLQPPQKQNNAQKGNPFAAMMGGKNGQNSSNAQPAQAKLAISADENANQLLVSANDSLFQEIESLVRELDYSAKMSRKSVRVVTLNEANSALIQNALTSLLPNVSISTTSSSRKKTTEQKPGSTNKSTSSGNPNSGNEDVRRFFEQRMRERMGIPQSGGNSTPGIGRPSRGFQVPGRNSGGSRGGNRRGRSR
ncbi:MAG: secretin N-terminal domain-containing protein, partial [Gimesia sp.]